MFERASHRQLKVQQIYVKTKKLPNEIVSLYQLSEILLCVLRAPAEICVAFVLFPCNFLSVASFFLPGQ